MKVILYMASTPNGIIAGDDDYVAWVSKKSWNGYLNIVRKIKCVIVGRKTYDVMSKKEFQKDCTYFVLSHNPSRGKKSGGAIFTNKSPKEVLQMLKSKGFKTAVVAGGGHLNASFMKEKLIDEIFLDVEPTILGKGINLFEGENFEAKLKLLGVKKLLANEVQLHYKVLK